ncbi:SusC/RagA family TonB-linked outer membrane protein [Massilibacteroides vaginae]|uniref:SusC/RagA family TonB-linked outer membrane protein n=1 Tax=Massilibacteroides vaginae TaxID=1673718 RepID=UPI001FE7417B|nr:SusC/RagA family TonB-linked outer membrane protein [Massilibacteroides vaginae]
MSKLKFNEIMNEKTLFGFSRVFKFRCKHLFRILKITNLLLFAVVFYSHSENAMSQKITLRGDNITLKNCLNTIEEQTEYLFIYDTEVNVSKMSSIEMVSKSVDEVLENLSRNFGLSYHKDGKYIVLSKKTITDNNSLVESQQKKKINGVVTDIFGEPIIGANIVEKGTTNGLVTDFDGKFTLDVSSDAIIQISYIGYNMQEIRVENQTSLVIKLVEDMKTLSEVVVVGYGTQTKVNLTGAVGTIAKDDLLDRPVTNVSSAIQGLTPGVTVTSGTGRPGQDGSTIRIRGVGTLNTSDPYILVDGIETGTINQIDPNDIESMSILKDAASAAIYGSKAANGVILITTKRGKIGKPTVSYSGNVSISNVATLIDRLNSYDHARLYNYALMQDGSAPRFTDEDLRLFKDGSDPYNHPNTVWTDYIYRTGFMHKHNLNVSGGSEDVKYMASAGYLGQEGTLRNSDRQQFNLRTNLDIKLSDKFNMRTNMAFINNKYSDPNASYGGGYAGFIWQADRIAPWIPYKREDGSYGSISDGNPAAWIDIDSRRNYLQQNFSGALAFDYTILEGLTFTLQGAYVTDIKETKDFRKECWYDEVNYHGPDQLEEKVNRWSRYTLDALLNYAKTFNQDHNLKVMGGYKIEKYDSRELKAFRKSFPNSSLTDLNAGDASTQTNSGYSRELAMMSYFGRINYDYQGKYLLEADFRADASSRFAKGYRWGYFPAFSAGWRISEEGFMEKTKEWLQSLKIRASWGQLGNQEALSDYYPSLTTLYIGKNFPFDNVLFQGITQTAHKISSISWEKATNWGVGFDANFLDEFTLSAEYYNRKTTGIIMNVPVPKTFGTTSAYQDNVGALRNSGIEFSVTWNHNFNKDWRFGVNANFAYNKNELLDLGGVDETIDGYLINRVGQPYQSFYVYVTDGLFQSDEEAASYESKYGNPWSLPFKGGDLRIKDVNGDGKLTEDDRVVKGSQQPKGTYGLTLAGGWKGFDLSVFMQGITGTNRYFDYTVPGLFEGETSHPSTNWLNAWSPENTNTDWPRIFLDDRSVSAPNKARTSFWCMNTNYLRIKNINFSYTLPKSLISKLGIANAKIYYTGENLFTFDDLPFNVDPEVESGNLNVYPISKSHSFGINVTF